MFCLASASPVRPEWIYNLNRELQLFAGLTLEGPLTDDGLAGFLERLPKPETPFEDVVIRGTRSLLNERNERASSTAEKQRICESVAGRIDTAVRHRSFALTARTVLEDRYKENWTLKRLAHEVGCNRTVLENAFKQLTGLTIHRFLITRRVEIGRQLLLQVGTKTSQMHADVGYRSRSAFYRHFKELTGSTPRQYVHDASADTNARLAR